MSISESDVYRRLIEQAPDAIIFADGEGVIRVWNARAQALFGYAPDEAIGRSLDLIVPEHLRAAHWRGFHQAIAAGHTRLGDKPMVTRAVHKDGGKLYVEFAFAIVRDQSGRLMGAVATGREAKKP